AFLGATARAATIVGNRYYLQPGRHPAPIFPVSPLPSAAERPDIVGVLPPVRPHEVARHEPARPHAESTDAKPRPPAAIAGSRKDAIADLLAGSPPPAAPAPTRSLAPPAQPTPPAPIPTPARSSAHPSRQVLAVQRALSEYGYGQLKPTGVYDADTRLAIQRFERDRRLPITGEISERVTRELANLTGRELN